LHGPYKLVGSVIGDETLAGLVACRQLIGVGACPEHVLHWLVLCVSEAFSVTRTTPTIPVYSSIFNLITSFSHLQWFPSPPLNLTGDPGRTVLDRAPAACGPEFLRGDMVFTNV